MNSIWSKEVLLVSASNVPFWRAQYSVYGCETKVNYCLNTFTWSLIHAN